jgi:uncharacterized protein YbjT (DUF2867 family)
MRILLTGATGFIGSHLCHALLEAGHELVAVARHSPPVSAAGLHWLPLDFAQALTAEAWLPHLEGVELVINAVGILQERHGQSFDVLHVRAPIALFDACVQAGVGAVLQISSLGADDRAETRYHLSKRSADRHLLALPIASAVLQPSLVFGPDGASASMMLAWASAPLCPLPAGGRQGLQPVHVDDLCSVVLALVDTPPARWPRTAWPVVGPEPVTLRDYLSRLRRAMGFSAALPLPVPRPLMNLGARVGGWWPGSLFDRDSWRMLERGNTGDPGPITRCLQRPPRSIEAFVPKERAHELASRSVLAWALPLARVALALVWLWTAAVSLGLYPRAGSLQLLAAAGVPEPLRLAALYGAGLLDPAFGVLTLLPDGRRPRWLWRAQGLLVLGYTVVITLRLPEYWLHPYGPISKNLPFLAWLVLLDALEERPEKERT